MNRFLSSEPFQMIRQIRMRDPAWFVHAENVAEYSGSLVQSLNVNRKDQYHVLASILFRRVASNFEAVLMLAERGMHTEGLVMRRSMLEALFVLRAVWKQPDILDTYIGNDFHRLLKIHNKIKSISPVIQKHLSPELTLEVIDEKIVALNISAARVKQKSTYDYAQTAGLLDYYLTDYSYDSEAAHHVAKDIERQIAFNSDGEIDGFYWGPEQEPPADLLSNAVDYMLIAIEATESIFEVSTSDTLDGLRTKTNELINRAAPDLSTAGVE